MLGVDLWLFALVAVTAAVWALGAIGDRYDVRPPLAFADGFPGPADAWLRHGEGANLAIDARGVDLTAAVPGESYAKRRIELPADESPATGPRARLLRVRSTSETLVAPAEDVPWQRPLVMVWVVDDEAGDTPVAYRTMAEVPGEPGTHPDERVIELPPGADSLWLTFQGRDSGGAYRLVDASVELVSPNRGRLEALALVAFASALLGVVGLAWLVRRGGRAVALALGLVVAGTLVGVLVPESVSTGVLRHRLDDVAFTLPKLGRVEFRDLYKLGHFAFFFAGALVAFGARRRLGVSRTRLALLFATLAVATEGVQLHLFDRTTRGSDIVVDLAGAALAALLVEALFALLGRRRSERRRRARTRRRAARDRVRAGADAPGAADGASAVTPSTDAGVPIGASGIASHRPDTALPYNPSP